MRRRPAFLVIGVLAAMSLLVAACGDDADGADDDEDVAEFYAENEVTLGVTVSPGGGLDSGARTLAPYLAEELGGEVTVVNQPMGDTSIPENWLAEDAEPDGLNIMLGSGASLFAQPLTQPDHAAYDHDTYRAIGRVWSESRGVYVGVDTGFETVDDVIEAGEFRAGTSNVGSSGWVDLMIFYSVIGLEPDIVSGYGGTSENELAILRGEVHGTAGPTGTLTSAHENPELHALVVLDEERFPSLPDTPTIYEAELVDMDDDQQALLEAHIGVQTGMGRYLLAPPDIPENRLQFLREAFERAADNPDFQQEMEDQHRPLAPLIGDEYEQFILDLAEETPDAYIEFLEAGT